MIRVSLRKFPLLGKMIIEGILTPGKLLASVDQEGLFEKYTGIKPGVLSLSPLREDDNKPSFIYSRISPKVVTFRDFGLGISGNLFKFLMVSKGISFLEAHEMVKSHVQKDFVPKDFVPRKETIIQIKASDWNSSNIAYWYSYGISRNTLEYYNVVPISHYWINGVRRICRTFTYAYKFPNNKFKILSPFGKQKWLSNTRGFNVEGYLQLDKKNSDIFITSSYKDTMVLYECGFNALNFNSETVNPDKNFVKWVLAKFKRRYILMDNDDPGIKSSAKLSKIFEGKEIFTPIGYKDPSDFSYSHSIPETIKIIRECL